MFQSSAGWLWTENYISNNAGSFSIKFFFLAKVHELAFSVIFLVAIPLFYGTPIDIWNESIDPRCRCLWQHNFPPFKLYRPLAFSVIFLVSIVLSFKRHIRNSFVTPSTVEPSLRGRRSKGKGKGIRARDHARGRREEGNTCKEAIVFAIPPTN